MKTYYLRGQVTPWTTFRGLCRKIVEAVEMIFFYSFIMLMIFLPIILMVDHLIAVKTSDKNFCPRLTTQELRIKYHCPIKLAQ